MPSLEAAISARRAANSNEDDEWDMIRLELGRCSICLEPTTIPFVCCPGPSPIQRIVLAFWRCGAFPDGELDLYHPLPQGVHTLHSECAGAQMAADSRCPNCRVELSEAPPWEFRLNGANLLAPTMQRPAHPLPVQAQPELLVSLLVLFYFYFYENYNCFFF